MRVEEIKEKAAAYREIGRWAKEYLKGTIVEKVADHLPDIGVGGVFFSFDTFGTVGTFKILSEFVQKELVEKQPYFNFSTPQDIAISISKIAVPFVTAGCLYTTAKKINDYFRDR